MVRQQLRSNFLDIFVYRYYLRLTVRLGRNLRKQEKMQSQRLHSLPRQMHRLFHQILQVHQTHEANQLHFAST